MASWNIEDINGFKHHTQENTGQINLDSEFGKFIYKVASNKSFNNYLEIGTWNGLGSTKCFIEAFKNRDNDFLFYSLECNTDKYDFANKNYKDMENVYILNEVLLNNMPEDIYSIFPEILENKDFNYWNTIDFNNMKDKPLFLNRNNLPEIFDVVLFDGGEFTTWYEYQILKNKCKVIMMDDTNCSKCKNICIDLNNQPDKWKLIFKSDERNGACCYILNSYLMNLDIE